MSSPTQPWGRPTFSGYIFIEALQAAIRLVQDSPSGIGFYAFSSERLLLLSRA
jgi:hypothetical protein